MVFGRHLCCCRFALLSLTHSRNSIHFSVQRGCSLSEKLPHPQSHTSVPRLLLSSQLFPLPLYYSCWPQPDTHFNQLRDEYYDCLWNVKPFHLHLTEDIFWYTHTHARTHTKRTCRYMARGQGAAMGGAPCRLWGAPHKHLQKRKKELNLRTSRYRTAPSPLQQRGLFPVNSRPLPHQHTPPLRIHIRKKRHQSHFVAFMWLYNMNDVFQTNTRNIVTSWRQRATRLAHCSNNTPANMTVTTPRSH